MILTAGLVGSAVGWALPVALGVVAALSWWIIAVRMVRSWHAGRLEWADVDVVIVDFDGTIADSMGPLTQLAVQVIHEELGLRVGDARSRYLASTGSDFATQLLEIDPTGGPARARAAHRFELAKPDLLDGAEPFPDLRAFLDDLRAAGVDVVVQIITSFVPSIIDPPTTLQNSTRICGADCTPSQIPLSQSRSN